MMALGAEGIDGSAAETRAESVRVGRRIIDPCADLVVKKWVRIALLTAACCPLPGRAQSSAAPFSAASQSPKSDPPAVRSLKELAEDTGLENVAFPAGSGSKTEQVSQSSSVGKTTNGATASSPRGKILRAVREPKRSAPGPRDAADVPDGLSRSAQFPAGMPLLHMNGRTPLPEILGKQRSGSTLANGDGTTGGDHGLVKASIGFDGENTLADDFAPYGRLVKCELVFTVDSLNLETPIVGLVMEDVWWNDNLIIPVGTEVFSKAVPKRIQNRIGDDGTWTFVLPGQDDRTNGRELILRGFALDRAEVVVEPDGRARHWNVSDGSAGLQGYVVDNADAERIKLFIATALSGAVSGFSGGLQARQPVAGVAGALGLSEAKSTLRNASVGAVGNSARDTLDLLAKQILEEVERNGAYVRVPSGKQFYVFVDQSIDPAAARVGQRLRKVDSTLK